MIVCIFHWLLLSSVEGPNNKQDHYASIVFELIKVHFYFTVVIDPKFVVSEAVNILKTFVLLTCGIFRPNVCQDLAITADHQCFREILGYLALEEWVISCGKCDIIDIFECEFVEIVRCIINRVGFTLFKHDSLQYLQI